MYLLVFVSKNGVNGGEDDGLKGVVNRNVAVIRDPCTRVSVSDGLAQDGGKVGSGIGWREARIRWGSVCGV